MAEFYLDYSKLSPEEQWENATQAFDLEIQALDTHELPERARYYQGIIDVDTLKSGELYSELKDSYVIFICISDIFGKELPIYRFENLCTDDPEIKLNDRAFKYFFISSKYGKIQNEKQRNFLQLVMNNEKTDELSSRILEKVKSAKQNVLVRKGYMDLIREKAYAAKDAAIAAEKRKADEDAIACLKDNVPVENVAKWINLPLEHVKELAKQLGK